MNIQHYLLVIIDTHIEVGLYPPPKGELPNMKVVRIFPTTDRCFSHLLITLGPHFVAQPNAIDPLILQNKLVCPYPL